MATKKCPACGKKVAAGAYYCLYCSHVFEEQPNTDSAKDAAQAPSAAGVSPKGEVSKTAVRPSVQQIKAAQKTAKNPRKVVLIVALAAVLVLLIALAVLLLGGQTSEQPTQTSDTTTTAPATTINAAKLAWLETFSGEWVDEESTGKGYIEIQGGQYLLIHSVDTEQITFDLASYSGGETPLSAEIQGAVGTLNEENVVSFTFENDGFGNSGEGHMQLRDGAIDIEVTITQTASGVSAEEVPHSLAMNATFARQDLPHSDGYDIRALTTWTQAQEVFGEQTDEPTTDSDGRTVYTCGGVKVAVEQDGSIHAITIDYAQMENKSSLCYECVDGTMTYDAVKAYYGEAEHDYVEQPTDIRVLYYLRDVNATVRFTFDADNNLLMNIVYTQ